MWLVLLPNYGLLMLYDFVLIPSTCLVRDPTPSRTGFKGLAMCWWEKRLNAYHIGSMYVYIYVFCNNSPSLVVFCAESGACSTLYGTLNMFSPVGQITIAREQALIRGEIIHGQFGHVQFVESKHDRALDPGPWPRAGRPQRIQEHLLCVCGSRLNCTPVRQRVENFVQESWRSNWDPFYSQGMECLTMFNHV